MQVILFCMLGMICSPSQVWNVRETIVVAIFLMVVARPLAVFICMIGSTFASSGISRLRITTVLRSSPSALLCTPTLLLLMFPSICVLPTIPDSPQKRKRLRF